VDIGRGPVTVHLLTNYDPARPTPLMLNLHGYSLTGADQEAYFGLLPFADQAGFIYAYPDGLTDLISNPFWNGTDACCDLFGNGVDDSTYVADLVDEIRGQLNVDPWRVHFTGWSNGGFMSYRMACDHADMVASLASLAGATFLNTVACSPAGPVHVLQIHGTSDGTIGYNGGSTNIGTYPGALVTVESWAGYNGCSLTPDLSLPLRDIDADIAGDETDVSLYDDGCVVGGSAQLWRIPGAPHGPTLTDEFRSGVFEFAGSHPKAGVHLSDPQTLSWPPVRWAQSYLVYRGDLADLFDNDGDGLADPGYGTCISAGDPDPTDTMLSLADTPAPGSGYFYAIGFVDAAAAASVLGIASSGEPREPAATCP